MKRVVGVCILGTIVGAGGCGSQPHDPADPSHVVTGSGVATVATSPTNDPTASTATPAPVSPEKVVLAQINGQPITMEELIKPLKESRGLALLLNIAQLDLAQQDAHESKVTVGPDDIKAEMDITLEKMFPDQPERDRAPALDQYLEKRNFSHAEFDTVVELNAYLRKAAMRMVQGKISDDAVEKEFGIEYGETAKCRMIVLGNAQEVRSAQDRIKAGEDFAEVARTMSRDARTRDLGGELPPFSLQTIGYPEQFRQLAFALQPGQVSDPLAIGTTWYLIKMEQKFPPKAVKFQSVKESLRKSMYDKLADAVMNELRDSLGVRVMQHLSIHDPVLARQFETLKARQAGAIHDRDKLAEQWKREREAATRPSSQPGSDEAGPPAATQPAATNPATTTSATPATTATATQPATR